MTCLESPDRVRARVSLITSVNIRYRDFKGGREQHNIKT
jgi:hypothetical protein